jgi:hypothetical protein
MSDTTILVIAAAGAAGLYFMNKKTITIPPPQPNYQYPQTQGQNTPYGTYPTGYPNSMPMGGGGGTSAAQDAASVIGALGGLAQGIGSVVRGIGSMGGNGGNDGYTDVMNWP